MDQQKISQELKFNIWFSGFYEGEGSISNDIGNRNKIRVSVSQNDPNSFKNGPKNLGRYY